LERREDFIFAAATTVVAQRRRWGKKTYIYVVECCVDLILGILAQQGNSGPSLFVKTNGRWRID
jgi:hypothetical protein